MLVSLSFQNASPTAQSVRQWQRLWEHFRLLEVSSTQPPTIILPRLVRVQPGLRVMETILTEAPSLKLKVIKESPLRYHGPQNSHRVSPLNTTPNSVPASPNSSTPPEKTAARHKRGMFFYLGLVGVITGGLCCFMSLVLVVLSFMLGNRKGEPYGTIRIEKKTPHHLLGVLVISLLAFAPLLTPPGQPGRSVKMPPGIGNMLTRPPT